MLEASYPVFSFDSFEVVEAEAAVSGSLLLFDLYFRLRSKRNVHSVLKSCRLGEEFVDEKSFGH